MAEPKRVPAGETATLHRCHHCGKQSKWQRNVDERSVERQVPGRVMAAEHATLDDLDPPLLAPEYRCPHCGHAHHSVSND